MCETRIRSVKPPSSSVTEAPEGLADRVPDGHVDGRLRDRVADGAVQAGVDDLALEDADTDDRGGEVVGDDRAHRRLGLAVGERSRRSVGGPDDTVVGVHPDQHVLGGAHLAAGEGSGLR